MLSVAGGVASLPCSYLSSAPPAGENEAVIVPLQKDAWSAVISNPALVVAAACGFRGGRIFPAVFVAVALGLMLHAHVEAVPAAITVSCAILGLVLVVTRDAWLSLFMAAVVVPDTTLLPLLCMVMLPAWLLLAGRPLMIAKRHTD